MMSATGPDDKLAAGGCVEDVQITGHIIDSLLLPKVLDVITTAGGSFRIKKITIGQAAPTRALPWWKCGPPRPRC